MTQVSSLYLHVPFCKHLCNYCDFYKRKLEEGHHQFESFHQFLTASLPRHEELLKTHEITWAPLDTIYFGGGTPSLWGASGASFFKSIAPPLDQHHEFTMEVDPGTWNEEMLLAWRDIGLNRISIGTQTLDEKFLKIMDRAHSIDESLKLLHKMQISNWNFSLDFLLGIPHSRDKKRDIKKELDLLLQFSPKHISLYILNARSAYPLTQALPDDDYIREEFLFVSDYLRGKGFHHYEVSNFALPGFESKHNQKYWKGESVAALGPTGTGFLRLHAEKALRYKWKVSKAEVELEVLGPSELELEDTYLSLRTSSGWAPKKLTPQLLEVFSSWEKSHYGHWDGQNIKLNSLGFLMLDSLMNDLFLLKS